MANISASQVPLATAKAKYPGQAQNIEFEQNSPNLVWIVFSGEKVVGVFKDWPSASAKIGEIEGAQLRTWLQSRKSSDFSHS
jgi:hypothetical protein